MLRAPAVAYRGPMKTWAVVTCACAGALLTVACAATTRYKVLSTLFDGVPPPRAQAAAGESGAAGSAVPAAYVAPRDHGPYAARLCGACHESAATNALVVPKDQLCFRCHILEVDRKYVHGPVASGGCLVCHDPHSSSYRYLLVSDSDSFCFHCHDRAAVAAVRGHDGVESGCTECHDAHASDTKYLLK
jgi:predicted CXXCH cytochrome family protein